MDNPVMEKPLMQKPTNPVAGDYYYDFKLCKRFVWDGTRWTEVTTLAGIGHSGYDFRAPTEQQLKDHETLNNAWQEFLVIKKLLGV